MLYILFIIVLSVFTEDTNNNNNNNNNGGGINTSGLANGLFGAGQNIIMGSQERQKALDDIKEEQKELLSTIKHYGITIPEGEKARFSKITKYHCEELPNKTSVKDFLDMLVTGTNGTDLENFTKDDARSCVDPIPNRMTSVVDLVSKNSSLVIDINNSNHINKFIDKLINNINISNCNTCCKSDGSCLRITQLPVEDPTKLCEGYNNCEDCISAIKQADKIVSSIHDEVDTICNTYCKRLKQLNTTLAGYGNYAAALGDIAGTVISLFPEVGNGDPDKAKQCSDTCKDYVADNDKLETCLCNSNCLDQATCDEFFQKKNEEGDKSIEEACKEKLGTLGDTVGKKEYDELYQTCLCQEKAALTGLAYTYNEKKHKCEEPFAPGLPGQAGRGAGDKKKPKANKKGKKGGTALAGSLGSGGLGSLGSMSPRRKKKSDLRNNVHISNSAGGSGLLSSSSSSRFRGTGKGVLKYKKKTKPKDIVSSKVKDSVFKIVHKVYDRKFKARLFKI